MKQLKALNYKFIMIAGGRRMAFLKFFLGTVPKKLGTVPKN